MGFDEAIEFLWPDWLYLSNYSAISWFFFSALLI